MTAYAWRGQRRSRSDPRLPLAICAILATVALSTVAAAGLVVAVKRATCRLDAASAGYVASVFGIDRGCLVMTPQGWQRLTP